MRMNFCRPPDGYDPATFELLRRYLAAIEVEATDLLGLVSDLLPNGTCDVNSIGPFSLNLLDGTNRSYPDGDAAARSDARGRHLTTRSRSSTSWRMTKTCRTASGTSCGAGGCARTSSETPAADRTSCTSATDGGWWASTC
jgi:hypothetical protein